MKDRKHTSEQIIARLREAEADWNARQSLGQVIQKLGVNEQTFPRWRNQYGRMKSQAARRLKELEQENLRLKKTVIDLRSAETAVVGISHPSLVGRDGRESSKTEHRCPTLHYSLCTRSTADNTVKCLRI